MNTIRHSYRPRPQRLPLTGGTIDFSDQEGLAVTMALLDGAELPPVEGNAAEAFVGITTDGHRLPGLFELADEDAPGPQAVDAARHYLNQLSAPERARAVLPIDAAEWRLWTNAFLTFPEHGLRLADLTAPGRAAALSVVEASLSDTGYRRLREAMRLNAELGQLTGKYPDTLTEDCYWFTLFGQPAPEQPWGWQLLGHHIDLHALFIGTQLVLTPTFLGVEFDGQILFAEHRRRAIELMDSLGTRQRDRALLYGSMLSSQLPPQLAGIVDGRHRAGAGRDNIVLPYTGLPGQDLSAGQRELLLALADPYLDSLPAGPRAHRRRHIEKYIDQTHLAWIGTSDPNAPFYYRLHSPVVLIEYDNHAGIFLDNDEPEPYHVHTIVRTPNGGDYGKDLLRQHYHHHHHTMSHPPRDEQG